MKNIGIIFFLILLASCQKDPAIIMPAPNPKPDPIVLKDSIVFNDYIPDVTINTVVTLFSHPSGCGVVWSPSDTNVIDSVYMENPAVYDLKFGVRNYYQFLSASNPCVNYNQTITMAFSLSSDSVAAYNQFNTCVRFLSKGDTIGNQLKFSRSGYIDTNVHNQLPFNCNFTGEQYLAIKKTVGKRTFYGWVLIERIGSYGIIIKESALNKSDDRPIICGQTK